MSIVGLVHILAEFVPKFRRCTDNLPCAFMDGAALRGVFFILDQFDVIANTPAQGVIAIFKKRITMPSEF